MSDHPLLTRATQAPDTYTYPALTVARLMDAASALTRAGTDRYQAAATIITLTVDWAAHVHARTYDLDTTQASALIAAATGQALDADRDATWPTLTAIEGDQAPLTLAEHIGTIAHLARTDPASTRLTRELMTLAEITCHHAEKARL